MLLEARGSPPIAPATSDTAPSLAITDPMTIKDIVYITPGVGAIINIDAGAVAGRENLILRAASKVSPGQIHALETVLNELPHITWASLRHALFQFQGNRDLSQLHRDVAGHLAEKLGVMDMRRRGRLAAKRFYQVRSSKCTDCCVHALLSGEELEM